MSSYALTRRGCRLLGILLLLFSIGLLFHAHWLDILPGNFALRLPPLYEKARRKENSLPHYKEYERKNVKFLLAANHFRNSGWGNVMQDYVMMGLLAHSTNRSFVFNDFVWNADGSIYSEYNGKKIPSRIPLSALLGGPTVGGSWPNGDSTPLSVSREFFHKVCPNPTILHTSEVNTKELGSNDDVPASRLFEKWVEKINSVDDPCVMLDPSSSPIFEYWIFGMKRLLSIWPRLSKSPVATHWEWSSIVQNAFRRNRHLFEPTTFLEWLFGFEKKGASSAVPGLLAIHVRRGDFKDHCVHLLKWSADWQAFNSFPEFHDKFERPTDASEAMELGIKRCYPTIEQIVDRVHQVRKEAAKPLRYLYVLTNGPTPWVQELKDALARNTSWDHVASSRDLTLTWEQKFVTQGLDMYVAQRAEVFIGNGWSSLTSNVVMLRMARGFEPNTNRFW